MSKWNMNGLMAVLFLLAATFLIWFCVSQAVSRDLSENAAVLVGAVVNGFLNITLIVGQYYFRKKPSEQEGQTPRE